MKDFCFPPKLGTLRFPQLSLLQTFSLELDSSKNWVTHFTPGDPFYPTLPYSRKTRWGRLWFPFPFTVWILKRWARAEWSISAPCVPPRFPAITIPSPRTWNTHLCSIPIIRHWKVRFSGIQPSSPLGSLPHSDDLKTVLETFPKIVLETAVKMIITECIFTGTMHYDTFYVRFQHF